MIRAHSGSRRRFAFNDAGAPRSPALILAAFAWMIVATGLAAADDSPPPFVVAFGDYNPPPYAMIANDELNGGIIYDIGKEFARRIGRPVRFDPIPRARLVPMLMVGRIDMICGTNPVWMPELGAEATWSPPLFRENEMIVASFAETPLDLIPALTGKAVGLVLGERYGPAMEQAFASGVVRREDSGTDEMNLKKLELHRIDAVIAPEFFVRYYERHGNPPAFVHFWQKPEESNDIYCLVGNKPELGAKTISAAFQSMVKDKFFDNNVAPYR
jgi:polar amino acid transport system substrate-binding protein